MEEKEYSLRNLGTLIILVAPGKWEDLKSIKMRV